MELSVVIPVLNEASNLTPLYLRLEATLNSITDQYEMIFVDDGSTDHSLELLEQLRQKNPKVKYVSLSRNFGHQVALAAGLDFSQGKAIVFIDADGQDPPELIPDLYQRLQEGYDVVYAVRKHRAGETLFKTWTAKVFYRFLRRLSKIPIPLDAGDFRIITRRVATALQKMPERRKFFRGQISWVGYKQAPFYYERAARLTGKSKYPLRSLFTLAIDGFTAFSSVPLKLVTWMGFMASGLAFGLCLLVLWERFFGSVWNQPIQPGWASQMITTLFLGGVQLIGIGILGEYIGRIVENVNARPLYLVDAISDNLEPAKSKPNS